MRRRIAQRHGKGAPLVLRRQQGGCGAHHLHPGIRDCDWTATVRGLILRDESQCSVSLDRGEALVPQLVGRESVHDGRYLRIRQRIGGETRPCVHAVPRFRHDSAAVDGLTEDRPCELEDRARVAVVAQSRRGRHRCDPAQRAGSVLGCQCGMLIRPAALEGGSQPAQQHRDVRALRAVIGVELVEDQVLEAQRALVPQPLVGRTQQ